MRRNLKREGYRVIATENGDEKGSIHPAALGNCVPRHAAIKAEEPRLHHEYQRAADRNPEYVDRWGLLSIFVLIRLMVACARGRSACYFASQVLIFSSSLLRSIGLVS